VSRLSGTPLDVPPGVYSVPMVVEAGPGDAGVGSLPRGVATLQLCVQPASAFSPPYFAAVLNPLLVAPFGGSFAVPLWAWLQPGSGANVTSVTGRGGGLCMGIRIRGHVYPLAYMLHTCLGMYRDG
jgi:hypothetical protein